MVDIGCECGKCVLCYIIDNNICKECEKTLRYCNCKQKLQEMKNAKNK